MEEKETLVLFYSKESVGEGEKFISSSPHSTVKETVKVALTCEKPVSSAYMVKLINPNEVVSIVTFF